MNNLDDFIYTCGSWITTMRWTLQDLEDLSPNQDPTPLIEDIRGLAGEIESLCARAMKEDLK